MFKECFKYYKSKNPPPSYEKVVDFNEIEKYRNEIIPIELTTCEQCKPDYGLKPLKSWKVYRLRRNPGLIFIKNPFTNSGQRYWIVRALRDYTRKPNKSNLDPFNLIPIDREWWDVAQFDRVVRNKLRWITLGYHHNWDTKLYSEDSKGQFPDDLHDLCRYIMEVLDFRDFNAEAAIINYYHMDSTLSGHTDYSEQDLEAPLISLSFGQTAIFLLGGKQKDAPYTTPILLESGDIVVMSKEARLCYHGVPRILPTTKTPWWQVDDNDWQRYRDYLDNSRININVRQVLKHNQKQLVNKHK